MERYNKNKLWRRPKLLILIIPLGGVIRCNTSISSTNLLQRTKYSGAVIKNYSAGSKTLLILSTLYWFKNNGYYITSTNTLS